MRHFHCPAYYIETLAFVILTTQETNFVHWSLHSKSHGSYYSYALRHFYCAIITAYALVIVNFQHI